ncbi:hypothetical protein CI109_104583 [Kwoniella shandongensis]|uniref:Uncharacterized protein n=1 Tax=Kwoniella shandongensis TaxID=1734106 RepID=A0A5M6BTC1_9TREE|nr:uncharacterized protein CI109_005527 [Kwoniella shandongensis]KAA5526094.1 hypothetical protein CI109_005527 [Kwoniella shandongensis]
MFIKRAKSRPSLRARDSDLPESSTSSPLAKGSFTADDAASGDISMDVDNNEEETSGSILERKKAQKKEKRGGGLGSTSKSKTASRLSFGGAEEEGEGESSTPFKPKKSLLSQQIKLLETPTNLASTSTPGSSTSGIYSQEYLTQLKASTPTRAPRRADADDDADEDQEDGTGLSRLAREKYASTFVEDTTAGIPDATAIAAAKTKRSAALEAKKHGSLGEMGEDYIALGGGKIAIYDGTDGPHPESRLMREEDEEGDGDEDMAEYTEANERMHLGKSANKAAARRLKGEIGEMIADREAEDEDDEETKEWERAQLLKAGTWEDEKPAKVAKGGFRPAPIPVARPVPSIASAQNRLAKSLADLDATKLEGEHNLEVTVRELAALEEQERELRLEVEKVEGKREWVEEFRGWVEMLGRFLEEKFPMLEKIEEDSVHVLKERAEMVNKRRQADDSDDLSLFLGVPASGSTESDVEEVDDLGRTRRTENEAGPSSGIRRGRRDERAARRGRRRAKATKSIADEDGFSTDSTLAEGDAEDYAVAQSGLEQRVHALLDDVRAEDFRDPDRGLALRFGGWRKRFDEEYTNAFGGLALVQAWEFWARGEMVGWEPLRNSSSLESFKWFNSLHHYSRPAQPANGHEEDDMDLDDEPPLGPDGDLVASMTSSAVVPLLTKAFEAGAYDPYSAKQTRRAVDLADVVAELMGKDSRKYTALLKAVLLVYHSHLLELSTSINSVTAHNSLPPPGFNPESRPAMERYVRRRIKLLKNILLWRREAPQEVRELVIRLVGEVLRPVLSRCWDGGGQEMAAKVLSAASGTLSPDLVGFLQQGPGSGW